MEVFSSLRKVFPGICFKNLAVSPSSHHPIAMEMETNLVQNPPTFALKLEMWSPQEDESRFQNQR